MVEKIKRKFGLWHTLFLQNRLKERFLEGADEISHLHVSKVRKYRNYLIKLIGLGVFITVFWPVFSGNWQGYKINMNSGNDNANNPEEEAKDTTPVMLKPRFFGEDENKQPYFLQAKSAVNLTEEKIVLFDINGNIKLQSDEVLQVISDTGDYFSDKKSLNLTGGVEIISDRGYILKTNSANLKVDKNMATGSEAVYIEGVVGDIKANGFTIQNSGEIVEFFNKVELNAYLEPREELGNEIRKKIETDI